MTGRLDRYGDPIEADDPDIGTTGIQADDPYTGSPGIHRSPEEIRRHCAELRAVLAEARARREVQP